MKAVFDCQVFRVDGFLKYFEVVQKVLGLAHQRFISL